MKTFVTLIAVLATAVANPLPLVHIIVNINGQSSIVNPIIERPIPDPNGIGLIPPHEINLPNPTEIIPDPVILPSPVLPVVIVPEPMELPEPVLPEIIVPAPLPAPELPTVIIPVPIIVPENLN